MCDFIFYNGEPPLGITDGEFNRDGVGIVNLSTGKVYKQFPTPKEIKYYKGKYFVHWRIGTSGLRALQNVQPFAIRSGFVATLGVIPSLSGHKKQSDAALFSHIVNEYKDTEKEFFDTDIEFHGILIYISKNSMCLLSKRAIYKGKNWIASFPAGPEYQTITRRKIKINF